MIFATERGVGKVIMRGTPTSLLMNFSLIANRLTEQFAAHGLNWLDVGDAISDIAKAATNPNEELADKILSLAKKLEEAGNEHSDKS